MIRAAVIVLGSLLVLPALAPPAGAQWRLVKLYLKPEVQVVRETREVLQVVHPAWADTLTLSIGPRPGTDIFGLTEQRRGSNPHRVWVATHRFWNNPARPRQRWGRYFRAPFLQLIRPPLNTHAGFPDS